jgi:capsular exopolysaccharide synthesis family protein
MTTARAKKPQVSVETFQKWCALGLRHARLVVLLMCASWTLGLAYYVFKRPVYCAKAMFRVTSAGHVLNQEEFFRDTQFFTIMTEISKPYMVEKIAATLGITGDYNEIRDRHLKRVRAVRVPTTGEPGFTDIEVRVYAYYPELTTQWLDRAMEVYYAERDLRRREDRLETIRVCRAEMDRMQAEMRAYAAKQEAFRERNAWDDVCAAWAEYKGVPQRLQEVQSRLTELADLRAAVEKPSLTTVERLSILSAKGWPRRGPRVGQVFDQAPAFEERRAVPLASERPSTGGLPPAGVVGMEADVEFPPSVDRPEPEPSAERFVVIPGMGTDSTGGWESLYQEKLLLDSQRAEIGKTYLAGHPKMRAVMRRLESVEVELKSKYSAVLTRLDWEQFILGEERKDLERKLPKVDEVRQRYEAISEQFVQLKYGNMPWTAKYNQLLDRMSVAKMQLDYGLTAPEDVRIQSLGYAEALELPVSPPRGKLLIACVFLGVVLSTAVVFLLESLDRTIALLDVAQEELGLRGLGIVPLVPQSALSPKGHLLTERRILEEADQRSLVETFRIIRANLLSCGSSADTRQVIMVTSSLPREGKSAVSTNLAMALARAGKRTLLIDADARRGRLQRELGTSGNQGLEDVLRGRTTVESVCFPTDRENLDLMGTGRSGSGLPELLASTRFTEGLAALRLKYDHIIIDTPPVLGLSEACDLLPCVDGVVLVIWAKYTPMREVKASLELLRSNRANFLGFVLNRVDLSNVGYYYHYYYYSDYYYRSYHAKQLPPPPAEPAEV